MTIKIVPSMSCSFSHIRKVQPHRSRTVEGLERDTNCDSGVGIPAVVEVIAVVDIADIDVVVVVPVLPPVFRPRVNRTDPIAAVLEARISAYNQERQAIDSESMLRPKVSAIPVFRDAVAAVAATLSPAAVVVVPMLGAMLLPRALLDTVSILSMPWLVAPPLLGVLLVSVLVLPLLLSMLLAPVLVLPLLLGMLLVSVLILPRLLLSTLLVSVLALLSLLIVLLGPGLLVLIPWLLRTILLFALPLVLRVGRYSHSEKQTQNGCAGDSNYFHRYYLQYRW